MYFNCLMFQENNFSMVFILPDKIDGLKDLESKLSSVDISQEIHTFEKPTVTVQIPKFKLETTVDLNSILQEVITKYIIICILYFAYYG